MSNKLFLVISHASQVIRVHEYILNLQPRKYFVHREILLCSSFNGTNYKIPQERGLLSYTSIIMIYECSQRSIPLPTTYIYSLITKSPQFN